MDTNGHEKIIDKIKKLIALSTSHNENEAMLAAQKVQELLADHNLSSSDILTAQDPNEEKIIQDNEYVTETVAWIRLLLKEVGLLYFCGYYYYSIKRPLLNNQFRKIVGGYGNGNAGDNHGYKFLAHVFVGAAHNVVVAKTMAEYFVSTVERLTKEASKGKSGSYQTSFINACSSRLRYRIYQRRMETIKQNTLTSDGKNLPALLNLYQDLEQKLEPIFKDMKTKKVHTKNYDSAGIRDGDNAGKTISLDNQITNQKVKQLSTYI